MNKILSIFLFFFIAQSSAQAALLNGSVLDFSSVAGTNISTMPADGSGSWFSLGGAGYFGISSFDGLVVGTTQVATGSHPGGIDGTELATISNPFVYYSQTALLGTIAPSNILSTINNTASVDFSGITWGYNGQDNVLLFESAQGDSGMASIVCALDCGYGDTYILNYSGHASNLTSYAGTSVQIHLEGMISTVPLPGAVWLLGSGLFALGALVRRK